MLLRPCKSNKTALHKPAYCSECRPKCSTETETIHILAGWNIHKHSKQNQEPPPFTHLHLTPAS